MTNEGERTEWSPGLIAFYLGCGFVSLGAAVGFSGYFVLRPQVPITVAGAVLATLGAAAMLLGLRAARKE